MSTTKPIAAIIGVGPGNGTALARQFSAAGYAVALLARSLDHTGPLAKELGDAVAIVCDASVPDSVAAAFTQIKTELGDTDTLIYNAGPGTWATIEEASAQDFERNWQVNALGLFVATQLVLAGMKQRGGGNILIVGATASRRGNARTVAFAPAKAAQRSLAEGLARHLWPSGIHVALVIIDGVVDLPRSRKNMPDKPDSFFVKPEALAKNVLWLAQQDRSAWTFEMEARPFGENW